MAVKRKPRSKALSVEEMTNMRIMDMSKHMADWYTGISEFESPSIQLFYDGVMKRFVRQISRFLRARGFFIIDKDELKMLTKGR
jgi:hypothetical protein